MLFVCFSLSCIQNATFIVLVFFSNISWEIECRTFAFKQNNCKIAIYIIIIIIIIIMVIFKCYFSGELIALT